MKVYKVTEEIDALPNKIWNILIDAPKYPEWEPNILKIDGTIAEGETITVHTKLSPDRAFPAKVTEFVPNEFMAWVGGMPLGLFKGERTFTLTLLVDDTTRFEMEEVFSGLLFPLIGRSMPDLTESFNQFAKALKARAEKS